MATKEEIIERIKVMQAWVDGRDVEYTMPGLHWITITHQSVPEFNFEEFEYRIKPQPKEIWVNEYSDCVNAHDTAAEAVKEADTVRQYSEDDYVKRVAIHYREVIE